MLGACFGSVIGIEVVINEGAELGVWGCKVLGTIFRALNVFSIGTYYGTEQGYTDGTAMVSLRLCC